MVQDRLEQSKSSFSCTILITNAYVCLNYSGLVASNNFYLIRPGDPDLALNNVLTSIHQLEPHPYHLEQLEQAQTLTNINQK